MIMEYIIQVHSLKVIYLNKMALSIILDKTFYFILESLLSQESNQQSEETILYPLKLGIIGSLFITRLCFVDEKIPMKFNFESTKVSVKFYYT